MPTMPDPLSLRILDQIGEALVATPSIRGAAYDLPFDLSRPKDELPFATYFDMDETFDAKQATDHIFTEMRVAVGVTFRYADQGESTPRRIGHRLRAELFKNLMPPATGGLCLAGLAHDMLPEASVVQDVLEGTDERLAVLWTTWRVTYMTRTDDLWTPNV